MQVFGSIASARKSHTFSAAMLLGGSASPRNDCPPRGCRLRSTRMVGAAGVLRQEILQRRPPRKDWLSGVLDRTWPSRRAWVPEKSACCPPDDPPSTPRSAPSHGALIGRLPERYVEATFRKPSQRLSALHVLVHRRAGSVGRRDEALRAFNNVLARRTTSGCCPDIDPRNRRAVGQLPQTFTARSA